MITTETKEKDSGCDCTEPRQLSFGCQARYIPRNIHFGVQHGEAGRLGQGSF